MSNETHEVSYNGQSLTQTNGYRPIGAMSYSIDAASMRFSFSQDFVIEGSSDSDMATKIANAESIFNVANKALTVTHEGTTVISRSPSANTALNTRGMIALLPDSEKFGQRMQPYRLTVTGQIPATEYHGVTTDIGFTSGVYSLAVDATQRPIYTFAGTFTAKPSNVGGGAKTARAIYEDATNGAKKLFTDWLDSNAIKGTSTNYEITDESRPEDDTNKTIQQFRLVARYKILPEVDAADADRYTIDSCVIGRTVERGFGFTAKLADRGNIAPRFPVSFQVRANSDDVTYTTMASEYVSKIRPYLAARLREVWATAGGAVVTPSGPVPFVIIKEDVNPSTDSNVISVQWMVHGTSSFGLLKYVERTKYSTDFRKTYSDRGDGNPHSYDVQSPGEKIRASQTIQFEVVSNGGGTLTRQQVSNMAPMLTPLFDGRGQGWEHDESDVDLGADMGLDLNGSPVAIISAFIGRAYTYRASGANRSSEAGKGVPL